MSRTWSEPSYSHRWPVHRRPDDVHRYWCHCDEPQPQPVTLFGVAMGGLQECASCHMPIADSAASNPRGLHSLTFVVALTTGQRLVFAVVALVFVIVFVVWPVVRPPRPKHVDSQRAWHRLMREIRRH